MFRSRDGSVLELGSTSGTSQSADNDALRRELEAAKLEIERLRQLLSNIPQPHQTKKKSKKFDVSISAIGGDEPLQELEPEETIYATLATKKGKGLAMNGQLLSGETDKVIVEAERTKATKLTKKLNRKKKPKKQAAVEHLAREPIDQHLRLSSDTSQDELIVM